MQLVTLLGLEAICSGELAIRMVAMKGESYEEIGGVVGVAVRLLCSDGGSGRGRGAGERCG